MMLAALGMFVFDTSSALFDELERQRSWRHGRTDRFGARAASQYLGPGDDRVRISGTIVPQIAGSYSSLETLAEMADAGDAYPFSSGSGTVWGHYTIESLDNRRLELLQNGAPTAVEFTMELARVADE